MHPTAEPQTNALAAMVARMKARLDEYDGRKAPVAIPPPPAPKGPRQCRISEARQGALWVADLTPDQRERAGIASDWKAQALADLDVFGGVPPAPERRIGRPRKAAAPIRMPDTLVRELPGAGLDLDPFAPSMPVRRDRVVVEPRPAVVQASTVGLAAVAALAMRRGPARTIGARGMGALPSARAAVPTLSFCGAVVAVHRHRLRTTHPASALVATRPPRAGPA